MAVCEPTDFLSYSGVGDKAEMHKLWTKWDAFIPEYSRTVADMGLKSTLNVQDNSYHG